MDNENEKGMKVNKTLLLLLPSLLALAISVTSIMYNFGQKVFDLNNTCYYIFFSSEDASGNPMTEEDTFRAVDDVLINSGIEGFTLSKNGQGGFIDSERNLYLEDSYQLILMDISRKKAYELAGLVGNALHQHTTLVEEVIISTKYVMNGKAYGSYEAAMQDE